jgi:pimeloyl-ACP methyl ester carboxylesterase
MLWRTPSAVAVVALAALLLAACSADSDASSTSSSAIEPSAAEPETTEPEIGAPSTAAPDAGIPDEFVPEPVEWEPTAIDNVDEAWVTVPVDYADPTGDTIDLYVKRHRALDPDERIGSLMVHFGGPGVGWSYLAEVAPQVFSDEILDRFDVVGFDQRGTGESDLALDCIDDYDEAYGTEMTPETDAEREANVAAAEEFAAACTERNPVMLTRVGTNDAARDLDTIRRALGEDEISYFGASYGSELGGVWSTLFPDTVRAAVLDGAVDPTASFEDNSRQQLAGFELALTAFLAACSADEDCEFHNDGDAEGAFDALMVQLDEEPLLPDPDRIEVDRGVGTVAVQQAMYAELLWPALERALADAQAGDGAGLLDLYDAYTRRNEDGTWSDLLEAFQVISCNDVVERQSVEESDAFAATLHEVAPRLIPEGLSGDYFCTFFPVPAAPRVAITGAGAGPIVVIGTTGDPATPLLSTEAMAATLEGGVLVVVEANDHGGYLASRCARDLVDAYLVDLEAPADGSRC